jgi:type VI secretion system protein ImpM
LSVGLVKEGGLGQAPGFFGKVRSLGDFVGRRLPPEVRDCFDRWLQEALVRSRQDLGDDWLGTWLSSPIWRFVVAAGVCGEQAWAGVMMPSHDRVGRCFPLLLMAGIDGTPSLRDCLTVHDGWFERLEELALSTLEGSFSLDSFDVAAIGLGGAPLGHGSQDSPAHRLATRVSSDAELVIEMLDVGASVEPRSEIFAGQSAWWSDGSLFVAPSLAICSGLPSSEAFTAFLDGRWAKRGFVST